MKATINSIGIYIPENKIENKYFENILETNDEWITTRTGIKSRYYSLETEFTTDLSIKAVENLVKCYDKVIEDVDFIIVATSTSEQSFPSIASQIQSRMNIKSAGCIDVSAGCAGFVYGIILAKGLIASGDYKKVLVIGAETMSKICDFTDRTTCILFGDGAGAVLVEYSEKENLYKSKTITDGIYGKDLYKSEIPAPLNDEKIISDGKIHQNGRTVFKWAVSNLPLQIKNLLHTNNLKISDIDWMIPHSANNRILEAICEELDYPVEQCLESIVNYGNTSAASIPIAWYNGIKDGKIKIDDKILLAGFGSGLTFSGICLNNEIKKTAKL